VSRYTISRIIYQIRMHHKRSRWCPARAAVFFVDGLYEFGNAPCTGFVAGLVLLRYVLSLSDIVATAASFVPES
jgi:hypothetical protein